MRLLPLKLLKEVRDEEAARLVRLKAELVEARRAEVAEPPAPADPAPPEPDGPRPGVLIGT
jgi:hypothetical protein